MASDLVIISVVIGAWFVVLNIAGIELTDFQQIAVGITLAAGAVAVSTIMRAKQTTLNAKPYQDPVYTQRVFSIEDLSWYDGVKNSKEARKTTTRGPTEHPLPEYDGLIFVGVRGVVYSVSSEWYGPDSPYFAFTGRDSSRHLGKVVVGNTEANCDWSGLDKAHTKSLDEWEAKFKSKYPVVGRVEFGPDFKSKAAQFEP